MIRPHRLAAAALAVALALVSAPLAQEADLTPPVAGSYTLDPAHASVIFSVSHIGLSQFTASFDRVSAELEIDPQDPGTARLSARIEAASLDLPGDVPGFLATMLGPGWFEVETHPEITFVSDRIELTGDDTAMVAGTLTLLGVARPVTLDVRYNAGYGPNPYEPNGRIGFSASAELLRSDFGMAFGIPPPGSDFGVGDRVTVRIEAEFVTPQPIRQ